jgi:hypothetical protein
MHFLGDYPGRLRWVRPDGADVDLAQHAGIKTRGIVRTIEEIGIPDDG